ncbi:hypothetical protein ZWY2020_031006 [Hordeum vulgare]|nr:hypothetical protein ZWY2020_031006 [Hordeum vulgare]
MVSWNDGETSEDSNVSVTSSYDGIIKANPNFSGINVDVSVLCEHDKPIERFVAFEEIHTRITFLGCGEKLILCLLFVLHGGINCAIVEWIDFEWPHSMEKALTKLWNMYEEIKAAKNNEEFIHIHNKT